MRRGGGLQSRLPPVREVRFNVNCRFLRATSRPALYKRHNAIVGFAGPDRRNARFASSFCDTVIAHIALTWLDSGLPRTWPERPVSYP